ncbi:MAG: putative membrane protein [Candidatus Atelocyanobacterium thalassa isolate SIO64986]|uniref:Putative membrane protein n=1 Tax=Candidatus Atelocyanobacterium thalassa isolate SIO64986 TaxID=1527444 RepID=A0A086CIE4_9CHRO|nr:MAG: putative membrane protein [Candidatus Atelocyanobacterium thalassa isolate SIO64986]
MRQLSKSNFSKKVKNQLIILGSFVSIFWIVELVDIFVFHGKLDNLGIQPHTIKGLRGIFLAPFLHGDLSHLINNTIPFLVLGSFVMLRKTNDFWIVTLLTTAIGGLGVWLFGPANSVHIGASILIFGYLGFLLLRGYFQKQITSICVSIIIFLLYGGLIIGLLPTQPGISWQGHLFGFLGGALAAKLLIAKR